MDCYERPIHTLGCFTEEVNFLDQVVPAQAECCRRAAFSIIQEFSPHMVIFLDCIFPYKTKPDLPRDSCHPSRDPALTLFKRHLGLEGSSLSPCAMLYSRSNLLKF